MRGFVRARWWRGMLVLGVASAFAVCWLLLRPQASERVALQIATPREAHGGELQLRTADSVRASRSGDSARFLSGRVQNLANAAIVAASVCVTDEERPEADYSSSQCVVTDARGRFTLPKSFEVSRIFVAAAGYLPVSLVPSAEQLARGVSLTLIESQGDVAGRVLDANGGPVVGALITVSADAGLPRATALTDSAGRFALGFAAGPVELNAERESYSRAWLRAAAPASDLTLVMNAASKIVGRVVTLTGDAPGATIDVEARPQDGPHAAPAVAATGLNGAFELNALAAGRYELVARGPSERSSPLWVSVGVGQTSDGALLTLRQATTVSGVITVGGEGCADGSVEFVGPDSFSANAALDGEVRVEGVVPGRYALLVRCAGGEPLHETLVVGAQPITRRWLLSAGLAVRGRVEDQSAQPLAGAWVEARPADSAARLSTSSCVSDEAGQFACSGLAIGTYDFSVSDSAQGSSEPVRVTVRAGTTPNVVLRTAAVGTIRATVTGLESGASSPLVVAKGASPFPIEGRREGRDFVFAGLRLGSYRLYIARATDESSAEARLERAGQVLHVSLSAPAFASIAGRVVDADGMPIADAWVRATASNVLESHLDGRTPALSDAEGLFVIRDLLPASYQLTASSSQGDGALDDVTAGATSALLRVESHADLMVRVRGSRGEPTPTFSLSYRRDAGETVRVRAGDGTAALPFLRAGRYWLEARAPEGTATTEVTLAPGGHEQVALTLAANRADTADGPLETETAPPF